MREPAKETPAADAADAEHVLEPPELVAGVEKGEGTAAEPAKETPAAEAVASGLPNGVGEVIFADSDFVNLRGDYPRASLGQAKSW